MFLSQTPHSSAYTNVGSSEHLHKSVKKMHVITDEHVSNM
jgi:hypothetical protein